jgi:hypothetical protein
VTQTGFTAKEQIALSFQVGEGGGEEGHMNHWHEFLTRWQATSSNAGSCVSCHAGHVTNGTAQAGFMVDVSVAQTCNDCHSVLREGGGG